jgi:hypothetical protein
MLLGVMRRAFAAAPLPPVTRAVNLRVLAAGLGMSMTMPSYLTAFPNARTSIFAYLKLDGRDVEAMVGYLDAQVAAQEQAGREFWPQVALETGRLSMAQFRRELARPDSLVDRNVRLLAANIARYRERKKWFFIRAFCEMNDGTLENPWEFANPKVTNTPADYAAAWKLLHDVFDAEGATNAIFVFSPLAAHSVHHEKEVLETLNLIPPGYIDAYGLNVYSRPLSAYGGTTKSKEPIPFATLAQPWLDLLARSKHRGIPLAVPEMGVSNQAGDTQRAAWLRAAFQFTHAHNFVLVTYFNYAHPYWQIDEGTQAGDALRAGIDAGPAVVPHSVAVTPPDDRARRRPPTLSAAPDLTDYRILNVLLTKEVCTMGEGLAVIVDPGDLPAGKLPYARIDRVVGRKLIPVADPEGLNLIRYGGEGGDEIIKSAWFKQTRLPDGRIVLIWERSEDGGPVPGEYEIRFYLSSSRLASGVQPRELGGMQRLHCDEIPQR